MHPELACQVPLLELLRAVPKDARLVIDDATMPFCTHYIPVGRYCHEAADALATRALVPEPIPAWKLVPIEPTRAMMCSVDDMVDGDKCLARGRAYDVWDRLLKAAPVHPALTSSDHQAPDASSTAAPLALQGSEKL